MTTLGVGGPLKYYAEIKTKTDLQNAIKFAETNNLKILVIGQGSNMLISDKGFGGLAIKFKNTSITKKSENKQSVVINVAAGVKWDDFVLYTVNKNYRGVECMSGIPGTVGASAVQNIGAYGQQISDVIKSVELYDISAKKFITIPKNKCDYSYRNSKFKNNNQTIIYSTEIVLTKNVNKNSIIHDQLKNLTEKQKESPKEIRKAVLKIRKSKSMVVSKNDPDSKSAGSFFTNPSISTKKAGELREKYDANIPLYENPDKTFKIAAAWLIENSGFHKGYIYKDTGLSTKHALAIINRGNSTAQEIMEFSHVIQSSVKNKFGIELVPEVVFVGF